MSTSGTPQSKNHSPLFRLPRELRDLIYELVFADLISNPSHIRKFAADSRWKVCYNPHPRVPGLLLTSKAIYSEAKSCLYSSCNPPRIVVDEQEIALHVKIRRPEEIGERWGFAIRDLETIVPILTTVEELTIEIKALGESPLCLLLVRWIRAVLNARKTPLRKVSVGVHLRRESSFAVNVGDSPERAEIIKEVAKINAHNRPLEEIWLLKQMRWDSAQGPPVGSAWKGSYTIQAEVPYILPCSVAWRDLIHGKSHYWVDTMVPDNEVIV